MVPRRIWKWTLRGPRWGTTLVGMHPSVRLPRVLTGIGLVVALLAASAATAHEPDPIMIADLTARLSEASSPAHALLVRAELHRSAGEWDAAARDLEDAAALDPRAPLLELCRAVLAFERGRAPEALPAFERYLALTPDDGIAHAWYARALRSMGRAAEAAVHYDAAFSHSRRVSLDLIFERVALADSLDGPSEALVHIERGLARVGASFPLEMAALDLEIRLHRTEAALERLGRLEQGGADPFSLGWRRGQVLRAAGRVLEADVAWTSTLEQLETRAETQPLSIPQRSLRAQLLDALRRPSAPATSVDGGSTRGTP